MALGKWAQGLVAPPALLVPNLLPLKKRKVPGRVPFEGPTTLSEQERRSAPTRYLCVVAKAAATGNAGLPNGKPRHRYDIDCQVLHTKVRARGDTGADVTCINERVFRVVRRSAPQPVQMQRADIRLVGAGGMGKCNFTTVTLRHVYDIWPK